MLNEIISFISKWQIILSFMIAISAVITIIKKIYDNIKIHDIPIPAELTEQIVDNYLKIFIPTKLQDKTIEHKNARKYSFNKFIDKYVNDVTTKYHYILGESGMGKSAFLINLYYYYNSKKRKKYKIYYYNLRNNKAINSTENHLINQLKNRLNEYDKSKTILLLDAYDEWSEATKNKDNAQKIIEENTNWAARVFITCRTQFFNTVLEEPDTLHFNSPLGQEHYTKHYICFFSKRDVKKYLKLKYNKIQERKLRKEAFEIIEELSSDKNNNNNLSELIMRPLMLSFIDYIVGDIFHIKHILFDKFLDKWIDEEVNYYIKTEYSGCNNVAKNELFNEYKEKFNLFIHDIALEMYNNKGNETFSISFTDLNLYANKYNLKISSGEREKSLLTRFNDNYFMFAHQSVFEFILAKHIRNGGVLKDWSQTASLDMFYEFICDIYGVDNELEILIKKDLYILKDYINDRLGDDYIDVSITTNINSIELSIEFDLYEMGKDLVNKFNDIINDIDFNNYEYLLMPYNKVHKIKSISYEFFIGNIVLKNNKLNPMNMYKTKWVFIHTQNDSIETYYDSYVCDFLVSFALTYLKNRKCVEKINEHYDVFFKRYQIKSWGKVNKEYSIYRRHPNENKYSKRKDELCIEINFDMKNI